MENMIDYGLRPLLRGAVCGVSYSDNGHGVVMTIHVMCGGKSAGNKGNKKVLLQNLVM